MMQRYDSGKGKKELQIFQMSDFKVSKTALFWDHLGLTKAGLKLHVISCLRVIRDI